MWGQVAAGIVNLTEWLLGDELDTSCVESPDLVSFIFLKQNYNNPVNIDVLIFHLFCY